MNILLSSIQRRQDETVKAYKLRLCRNKDLYEITWDTIASLINKETGDKFGESKYRKWYASYREGYEDSTCERDASSQAIDESLLKQFELQKEQVKLQSVRHEFLKRNREKGRQELFESQIIEAASKARNYPIPKVFINKKSDKKTFVLPVADMHYGAEFEVRGLKGERLNKYNVQEFEKRMWHLLQDVVTINDKEKINHVHLANLSDSIDGILRMSQLQSLELGVVDSVIGFSEFMGRWLNELSKYMTIDYHSTQGNHTEIRHINSKRGDFPHENTEKITTWYLSGALKENKNITIHKNKHLCFVDILGNHTLFTHGQDEKKLENSLKDYMLMYQQSIDTLITGHLHHEHEKTIGFNGQKNVRFIQVPSICGIDEYSMKLKKTAKAGTKLMIFEQDKGRVASFDIVLN